MSSDEAIQNGIQNSFGYAGQIAQQEFGAIGCNWTRPCVLHRPTLSKDGDQWCVLLGDNIQSGLAAFGETPAKAMDAFDDAFYGKQKGGGDG